METPNYDIEQSAGALCSVLAEYRCLYRTENPVVWDYHPVLFTCFSDAADVVEEDEAGGGEVDTSIKGVEASVGVTNPPAGGVDGGSAIDENQRHNEDDNVGGRESDEDDSDDGEYVPSEIDSDSADDVHFTDSEDDLDLGDSFFGNEPNEGDGVYGIKTNRR
ncbi:hypothetical protein PIB30_105173 [Stylosanthes scabra]|uniref:Uncharacterized protein n=1 Tax=Stylosanthes scabra TaxID=79078 RepID=A0ABU6UZC7_9FABA|nr:hypothetical protein [Stylosanthes scabra]